MSLNIDFPDFNHPEVRAFYEHDLYIPKEKVEAILQLPRETLIEDMETIIMDTIQRDKFFRDWEDKDHWWSFNFHALWVLAELEAVEAFPTVFKLLEQSEVFGEYWWGEYSTEGLDEIYYLLANNKLEEFKAIVLAPGYWIHRIIPSNIAKQIFLNHPEREQEVLDWYHAIFDAFLEMEDENEALEPDVICSMIVSLISIQADEFLPKIKVLYERGFIYDGYVGNMESIESDIKNPKYRGEKRDLKKSIYERYEEVRRWAGYQMKYNKEAYEAERAKRFSSTSTPIRKSEKISRNAPCPCGSGKKYKKCCLKK